MDKADSLLAELLRLASVTERPDDPDAHLREMIAAAARLLGARRCTFLWLNDVHSTSDRDAAADAMPAGGEVPADAVFKRVTFCVCSDEAGSAPREAGDAGEAGTDAVGAAWVAGSRNDGDGAPTRAMCSRIRHGGRTIAIIRVSGPLHRPRFDADDQRLLDIVTLYIGKSLQVVQLQGILQSRFAQLALAHEVDNAVGQVLAAVPNPAGVVRVVAKSFYREMTRMGFGSSEIVNAASQIISELSTSVRRHARRAAARG